MAVASTMISSAASNEAGPRTTSAVNEAGVVLHLTIFALLLAVGISLAEILRGLLSQSQLRSRLQRDSVEFYGRYGAIQDGFPDESYETLLALSDSVGRVPVGLTEEQIHILPTCHYAKKLGKNNDRTNIDEVVETRRDFTGCDQGTSSRRNLELPNKPQVLDIQDNECTRYARKDDTSCAICRENLLDGDELLILPCQCLFHKECISQWLTTSASCPLCRCSFA